MGNIVALRTDGFGQRLKVILQAIRIAENASLRMKFTWEEKRGAHGSFHACERVGNIFSEEFLARHYLDHRPETIPWKAGKAQPSYGGDFSIDRFMGQSGESFRDEFGRIGFSSGMQRAIDCAEQVDVGLSSAIHLRGGDILYGELRKHALSHQDKVIPISVAKRMFASQSARWIVFAQDAPIQDEVRSFPNVVVSSDLWSGLNTNAERTIFDMVLMSRCEAIWGGSSAVCDIASVISGKVVRRATDIYDDQEIIRIIRKDSRYQDGGYDNFVMASLNLSLFFYAGGRLMGLDYIREGARCDPANPSFDILNFYSLCEQGRLSEADEFAKDAAATGKGRYWPEIIRAFMSRAAVRARVLPQFSWDVEAIERYKYVRAILEFSWTWSGRTRNPVALSATELARREQLAVEMQRLLGGK